MRGGRGSGVSHPLLATPDFDRPRDGTQSTLYVAETPRPACSQFMKQPKCISKPPSRRTDPGRWAEPAPPRRPAPTSSRSRFHMSPNTSTSAGTRSPKQKGSPFPRMRLASTGRSICTASQLGAGRRRRPQPGSVQPRVAVENVPLYHAGVDLRGSQSRRARPAREEGGNGMVTHEARAQLRQVLGPYHLHTRLDLRLKD